MKKLSKIQVLNNGKNLDDFISKEANPVLSSKKMNKITGGRAGNMNHAEMCDAVCLPSEMGGCSCNSAISA